MAKKYNINLNKSGSIDKVIAELERYEKSLERKEASVRRQVAKSIMRESQAGFDASRADSYYIKELGMWEYDPVDVSVSMTDKRHLAKVTASGEDAVWVEFGAGVAMNTPVGTSPNPYGQELGFTIGSFGKGNGRKNSWGYRDVDGRLVVTKGTKATMPMYRAVKNAKENIGDIAKEVFK